MISDVIVLYVLKKRRFYKENKYQQVYDSDGEQDYEVIDNPPAMDAEKQTLSDTVSLSLQVIKAIVEQKWDHSKGLLFCFFFHRSVSIILTVVTIHHRPRVTSSESPIYMSWY